jgi:hypothetical protein
MVRVGHCSRSGEDRDRCRSSASRLKLHFSRPPCSRRANSATPTADLSSTERCREQGNAIRALDDVLPNARWDELVADNKTATANLAAARHAAAVEDDKASAREVAKVLAQLAEHAEVVDDCLADLVTAGDHLRASLNALRELGVRHISHEMLATYGHLAILTALNKTIWRRGFETLAPGQRKTFGDVVAAWRTSLMADVGRRLGEDEPAKEEAAA